jgi:hypothetical protein
MGAKLGRVVLDLDAFYREHAAHCARLMSKKLSPTRRFQLKREQQDWLVLADQQRTWRASESEQRAPGLGQ